MSWRLPGRPSSISSTLRVPPSARVSTSCNTQPIHDPPAGNGPAGHIAPSAHPQSLNTPLLSAPVRTRSCQTLHQAQALVSHSLPLACASILSIRHGRRGTVHPGAVFRPEEASMAQTVADILVETLARIGVRQIFGVVGDALNPLTDAVRRQKIVEWIGVRHEEGAALPAAGQAAYRPARRVLRYDRSRRQPLGRRSL